MAMTLMVGVEEPFAAAIHSAVNVTQRICAASWGRGNTHSWLINCPAVHKARRNFAACTLCRHKIIAVIQKPGHPASTTAHLKHTPQRIINQTRLAR
jgi:hypothetical protein